MNAHARPDPAPVDWSYTPLPWDAVEATENHGPYITTAYGTTVCDLYAMTDPHSDYSIIHGIKKAEPRSFTDAEKNAALITTAVNSYATMFAALVSVRKLIAEAAMTGFNCKDGDWAERLFASQAFTTRAINMAAPKVTPVPLTAGKQTDG